MSIRHVHLGLGAFHRAHQAWYTQQCGAAQDWGIAAFTGRSDALADELSAHGCRYTVIERGPVSDSRVEIGSIHRAHRARDTQAWLAYLADPQVAVLTLTVTEAAYRAGGVVDRIVAGLHARRDADAGPIALVPCDNVPGNGDLLSRLISDAAPNDEWIAANVTTVNTLVDRITPASTGIDVITEPYSEWVLSGAFAARPPWQEAGARFVADVAPYEQRKLWLLNGAHSLLAYTAPARGHATVAEAMADDVVAGWVRQWWDEAGAHLPLPAAEIATYRDQLTGRFANPRIEHRLAQIAQDGAVKLPIRILPVLRLERAAGRMPAGAVRALAGWATHQGTDPRSTLAALDPALAEDADLVAALVAAVRPTLS